jgi:hypothetical protein
VCRFSEAAHQSDLRVFSDHLKCVRSFSVLSQFGAGISFDLSQSVRPATPDSVLQLSSGAVTPEFDQFQFNTPDPSADLLASAAAVRMRFAVRRMLSSGDLT